MTKLDISGNTIGDAGATALSQCIHILEKLYLIECNITEKGVEELSQELMKKDNRVSHFFYFKVFLTVANSNFLCCIITFVKCSKAHIFCL